MAVFDRGEHTLEVWPPVNDTDQFGNPVVRPGDPEIDTPTLVHGALVQPVTEDSDSSQGDMMLSVYRVICRSWPWQRKCLVRWRDQFWDVKTNPNRRPYSRRTSHDTVIMRAREEEMHGDV